MKSTRERAPRITIRNLTRKRIPAVRSIKRTVERILKLEKSPALDLSVTYVSDAYIRKLNLKFRGRDSATDVLAFSMREGKPLLAQNRYLGDVVISLDAAKRQAKYFKSTMSKELKLYLIHGMLHLLGYDDETKTAARKMKRREEELMYERA